MTATWIDGPALETKPRISKSNNNWEWRCIGLDCKGIGTSPFHAYKAWALAYRMKHYQFQ